MLKSHLTSVFKAIILFTFLSTKPGGKACLYLHDFPLFASSGQFQNQPYLLFSNASRKNLQIWKEWYFVVKIVLIYCEKTLF